MAARSIGNGTLSFGMVSIPIRMYSAGESSSAVSFNMLHDKCKSRLKQQYICPKDNEIVTREHTVKGYEFAKDQYVSFTPDELKAMDEEAQKAIEITEFVPSTKVDPVYFDGARVFSRRCGQGRHGLRPDRPRGARTRSRCGLGGYPFFKMQSLDESREHTAGIPRVST